MERITITFEPLKQSHLPPTSVRLKRWLKSMLRGYGLKCITINGEIAEEVGPDNLEGENDVQS